MKRISKFNFLICCFALSVFVACRNNTPEAAATESHIPGDTVKITDTPERFQVIGIDDPKIVNDFVQNVKMALESKDKTALAAMCIFPLRVNAHQGGKHTEIANAAAFEQQFDKIFPQKSVTAILSQPNSDLFANYQGLMLGNGQAWAQYDADTKMLKIFSVNN
jgi:hypothetical protein